MTGACNRVVKRVSRVIVPAEAAKSSCSCRAIYMEMQLPAAIFRAGIVVCIILLLPFLLFLLLFLRLFSLIILLQGLSERIKS